MSQVRDIRRKEKTYELGHSYKLVAAGERNLFGIKHGMSEMCSAFTLFFDLDESSGKLLTNSESGGNVIVFKQKEKGLYSAVFDILKDTDVIGTASLHGDMVSITGDWDIDVCGEHISLKQISAKKVRLMAGSLTSDVPFGQMEIYVNGIEKGVVFQGIHKKSLFREYNVHHIIYDGQTIYNMYPIGFGEEGAKNPVYVEEHGVERQVALTEKSSVVYNDMHEFFCYMDDDLIPTIIIFCALMYSLGCYKPGTKIIEGVKRTISITKEEKLLSKYDPKVAEMLKTKFSKGDK